MNPHPPPPYPAAPGYSPRSPADIIVTIVLSLVAVTEGVVAFFATGFFAMAADGCPNCNETMIGLGFAVSWGGLALTAVGALLGIVIAAKRGRALWVWPALAMALIVVFFLTGGVLANSGINK